MKSFYSILALMCLTVLFVLGCSKDDTPTPEKPNTGTTTQTPTTQTGTTQTGTTQSGTTTQTPTTQTGTTQTGTTQSGTTTQTPTTQTGTTQTGTTQPAQPAQQVVKIKVTEGGKPLADRKVYGIAGDLAFQGIKTEIANWQGQNPAFEGSVSLIGTTDAQGMVTFTFKRDQNIPDYYFFVVTAEEPFVQEIALTLDGKPKEGTIALATKVQVSFTAVDSENKPVKDATITVDEQTRYTNEKGVATFVLKDNTDFAYVAKMPCGSEAKGTVKTKDGAKFTVKFTVAERGEITLKNNTGKACVVKMSGKEYQLNAGESKVVKGLTLGIYDAHLFVDGKEVNKYYGCQLNCQSKTYTFDFTL